MAWASNMLEAIRDTYVTSRFISAVKRRRKAAGADPELQESDVTAPASPRAGVIILKGMRRPIKAGTGAIPRQHPGVWAGPRAGPLGAALLALWVRAGALAAGTCPPTPG